MYTLKNGYLYKDDKKVFCLGLSYYPSYHKLKVPVPEDGDRIGEMKKDLRGMKDAGFNLVRVAAIGDVFYDKDKNVEVHTEFIDEVLKEADKVDIATMIRLQGYSMNLSGYDDFLMIGADGKPMDTSIWYDFIQNCLQHEGILKDNDAGTAALAKHYKDICNVVCFQTYNEPHYPSGRLFDYHPMCIEAYRKWLVKHNIMTESEAQNYTPPKARPFEPERACEWINWRRFASEELSRFLIHSSDIAKSVSGVETMTCQTTCQIQHSAANRGVNYYYIAEKMDAVGTTHYLCDTAPEIYLANMHLDMCESAAALYDKPMWIVEYDARTNIPLDKFRRETYLAIGSGCAGIMYYQWRGDHVFPNSPEGNGFGLINYDSTPTKNYNNALNVTRLVNSLSDYIINAKKLRDGVALIYSEHAYLYYDAIDNPGSAKADKEDGLRNTYRAALIETYKALREENITVDIIRATDLKDNHLNIKLAYTPTFNNLSDDERECIDEFHKNGGIVYAEDLVYHLYPTAFTKYGDTESKYDFTSAYSVHDTLELANVSPNVVKSYSRDLLLETLYGDGYYIICLTNGTNVKKVFENVEIKTRFDFKTAVLYTFEEQKGIDLECRNNSFIIDKIDDGAFVILK